MRYRFYEFIDKNTNQMCIAAVSSFAKKDVRAVAKCDPSDTYDYELGKKIATARLDSKIADKRCKYSGKRLREALRVLKDAQREVDKMLTYRAKAIEDQERSEKVLDDLMYSVRHKA